MYGMLFACVVVIDKHGVTRVDRLQIELAQRLRQSTSLRKHDRWRKGGCIRFEQQDRPALCMRGANGFLADHIQQGLQIHHGIQLTADPHDRGQLFHPAAKTFVGLGGPRRLCDRGSKLGSGGRDHIQVIGVEKLRFTASQHELAKTVIMGHQRNHNSRLDL